MLRNQPAKFQSLRNFCMKLYSAEGLSSHSLHILPENLFEPNTTHRTNKSQIKFIHTNESLVLRCNNDRVFLCILNK